MESNYGLNKKSTLTTLMIALVIMSAYMINPSRIASADITIFISPVNHHGKVGDSIHVVGTINQTNGPYQILFGNLSVAQANAVGNTVNATFPVPKLPGGNYTLILKDIDVNATAPSWFYIDTAYYIQTKTPMLPEQLRQNSTVEVWVNVTGGARNSVYRANITVKNPTPANQTHWATVTLSNTTDTGAGYNTSIFYPTYFSGAHTNYTGTYSVAFNRTLASTTFTIGLTDRTEYHRKQFVNVKAAGYKPSENVTVKVTFGGKTVPPEINLNATNGGIVSTSWQVPPNASMGTYTLSITSITNITKKNPPDIQSFTIPGYDVNMTIRNLAGETVPNVAVRIYQDAVSIVNKTSTATGLVQLKLESENYTAQAFYRNEKVGERQLNVTGSIPVDFYCNLTNLKVDVIALLDDTEIPIPEAKIYLTFENKTLTTGLNGTAIANSLLPKHDYTLNVSRYDKPPFNTTTIQQLPAKDWYNITITCPTVTLEVSLTDGENRSITDELKVTAQELMGGLYYVNYTANSNAILRPTIGKYTIAIYGKINGNYVELNATSIDLFENMQLPIVCKLYGLDISVQAVDYFGQIIPNTNIMLYREDLQYSPSSESGGTATFNNIIGGNLQVRVNLAGQSTPLAVTTLFVDESQTIQIKVDKYVVLAGMLVETSQLATAIVILLSIILVILLELYSRRKRVKPQEKPS
jgi:hypothetical protein